jgi:hypothetical protein
VRLADIKNDDLFFLSGPSSINFDDAGINSTNSKSDGTNIYANEYRFYVENNIKIGSKFKANIGVHSSLFNVQNTLYNSIEPRISGTYIFSGNNSVKASYTQTKQYLHLLTNSGFGLPSDLWVPPTSTIKPQQAQQFAAGFYQKLSGDITLSVETYYKELNNLIAYKENSSFFIESKEWDTKVLNNGEGTSYGIEFFFQKNTKKMQVWLGYTLSKTTRRFDLLNNGKEYSYKYDRTHDISLNIIYNINKKISVSANWVFGTGNAVSLPIAVYPSIMYPSPDNTFEYGGEENDLSLPLGNIHYRNNTEIFEYGERNSQRLPAYHRLDINILMTKKKKRGERTFALGLYNVYSRRNPYYLTYAYNSDAFGNYNAKGEFRIVSLFPVLPSISYSFKF